MHFQIPQSSGGESGEQLPNQMVAWQGLNRHDREHWLKRATEVRSPVRLVLSREDIKIFREENLFNPNPKQYELEHASEFYIRPPLVAPTSRKDSNSYRSVTLMGRIPAEGGRFEERRIAQWSVGEFVKHCLTRLSNDHQNILRHPDLDKHR